MRAADDQVHEQGQDGGLVSAILIWLLDNDYIESVWWSLKVVFDAGLLVRVTGDIIALSPPLIVEKTHIDQMVETLRTVLSAID